MTITKTITMTKAEWEAEGVRRFGPDRLQWKFVCPACGHVAAVKDWQAAKAPASAAAFSCVGRWTGATRQAFAEGEGPCNYAGGGLIGLNPVNVEGHTIFEFAPEQIIEAVSK